MSDPKLLTTAGADPVDADVEERVFGYIREVLAKLDPADRSRVLRRVLFVLADSDCPGVAHRLEPSVRWIIVLKIWCADPDYARHTVAHEIAHVLGLRDEDAAEAFADALGFPHPFTGRFAEEEEL